MEWWLCGWKRSLVFGENQSAYLKYLPECAINLGEEGLSQVQLMEVHCGNFSNKCS